MYWIDVDCRVPERWIIYTRLETGRMSGRMSEEACGTVTRYRSEEDAQAAIDGLMGSDDYSSDPDDYEIEEWDGDDEPITITMEPEEPDCDEHDHNWALPSWLVGGIESNPGCWGSGGGVRCHSVCLICGLERITDSWAQNSNTGEQGLDSIKYRDDEDNRVRISDHMYNLVDASEILARLAQSATTVMADDERDVLIDEVIDEVSPAEHNAYDLRDHVEARIDCIEEEL
jgi:hypothetical protein